MALSEFIAILGLTMEDLSSQEASCLREWVADTDPAIVADPNLRPPQRIRWSLLTVVGEMMPASRTLFISGIIAEVTV